MLKELFSKWFGLEYPPICGKCELLRFQLEESNRERRELLARLLERNQPEPTSPVKLEEMTPIKPQFTPWRVRQQMLEAEDREKARLLRKHQEEVNELEKELKISNEGEK